MKLRHIAVNINNGDVLSWTFSDENLNLLKELLPGTTVDVCSNLNDFLSVLPDSDGCMVWQFKQEWFALAPELKILSTPAAGKDYFSVALPPGVISLNGSFHGEIIGETVCGMLLGMSRALFQSVTYLSDKSWFRSEYSGLARPLRGSHAVILGFGNIGEWIGRLLKPFGVKISGMRKTNLQPPEWFTSEDRIFTIADLDTVLRTANHLILALPRSPETDYILNASRIAMLPAGATVINVGRGNAIEENALCSSLKAGHLSGAFLDVFETEPLPETSPLRSCPNLWILPHASAISPNYLELYIRDFANQLASL